MRSPHTTQFSVEGHPFRYRDHVGLGSKQLFCNDKRNRISGKQNSFSIVLPCRQHTNPTSWQAMIVENIGTSSTLNAPRNLKKTHTTCTTICLQTLQLLNSAPQNINPMKKYNLYISEPWKLSLQTPQRLWHPHSPTSSSASHGEVGDGTSVGTGISSQKGLFRAFGLYLDPK